MWRRCMTLQAFLFVLLLRLTGCVLVRIMTGRTQHLLPGLGETFRLYHADWLIPHDLRVFAYDITRFDRVLSAMTLRTSLYLIRRTPRSLFETHVRICWISGLHHIRMVGSTGMATLAADIWNEIDQMVTFNPT